MTVQSHPRTQLPALQLLPFFWSVFPTLDGMLRGGCLVGAGRTCVADPVLVHVLGITLQAEACVSRRAHGQVPITWHRVRALLMHPHAAASSPAACPPASVSTHQPQVMCSAAGRLLGYLLSPRIQILLRVWSHFKQLKCCLLRECL